MSEKWGKVRRRALIGAGAVVVLGPVGFAIVLQVMGKSVDQVIGEPFFGFTHHQWNGLLSGVVGAVVGGLVAVVVLLVTLAEQRRQFERQLKAQDDRQYEQRAIEAVGQLSDALNDIDFESVESAGAQQPARREVRRASRSLIGLRMPEQILSGVALDIDSVLTALIDEKMLAKLTHKEIDHVVFHLGHTTGRLAGWHAVDNDQRTTLAADMVAGLSAIATVLREKGWTADELTAEAFAAGRIWGAQAAPDTTSKRPSRP